MDLTGREVHLLTTAMNLFAKEGQELDAESREFRQKLAMKMSLFSVDVALHRLDQVVLKGDEHESE